STRSAKVRNPAGGRHAGAGHDQDPSRIAQPFDETRVGHVVRSIDAVHATSSVGGGTNVPLRSIAPIHDANGYETAARSRASRSMSYSTGRIVTSPSSTST